MKVHFLKKPIKKLYCLKKFLFSLPKLLVIPSTRLLEYDFQNSAYLSTPIQNGRMRFINISIACLVRGL